MSKAMPVRNGMLKILTYEETQVLIDRLGPKVSHRRLYIKLACIAVLKYDADGRYLNANQIAELGSKYLAKTVGLTGQTVGTVLGILYRMGVVNRSYNRPHSYWWREEDED
tara:strand:- start:1207 stop:1539 length:333 start_codon:yes stop_codon:yes gene_type:complete